MEAYGTSLERQLKELPHRHASLKMSFDICGIVALATGLTVGILSSTSKLVGVMIMLSFWAVGWFVCQKLTSKRMDVLKELKNEPKISDITVATLSQRKLKEARIKAKFTDNAVATLRPQSLKELRDYVDGINLLSSVSSRKIGFQQLNYPGRFIVQGVFSPGHGRCRIVVEASCQIEEGEHLDYLVNNFKDENELIQEIYAKVRRYLFSVINEGGLEDCQIIEFFSGQSRNLDLPNCPFCARIRKLKLISP